MRSVDFWKAESYFVSLFFLHIRRAGLPLFDGNEAPAQFYNIWRSVPRSGGAEALPYLAVPCGTGFRLEPALFSAMRDGLSTPDELLPWSKFLRRYGI
jgi:hypothetical protein